MDKQPEKKINLIKEAVSNGNYRYTVHGAKQRVARRIKRREVEEAIDSGEIIEDYLEHHYGPACLLLGRTNEGKALHMLYSLQKVVDIITIYEPDLTEWENDLRTRRK